MSTSSLILLSALFILSVECGNTLKKHKAEPQCQRKIYNGICKNYQHTSFPNLFGHQTQDEAYREFNTHLFLFYLDRNLRCHRDLEQFMCLLLFPKCSPNEPDQSYPPCRAMCESVQQDCLRFVQDYSPSYTWEFPCHAFPTGGCVRTRRDLHMDLTDPPVTQQPERLSCQHDQFKCADNLGCIPISTRCDGIIDCQDRSDETSCGYCSIDAFQCGNGKCVPHLLICDGDDNCGDNSDEVECTQNNIISKMLEDMHSCDCSSIGPLTPSYTDICITENILKVQVTSVKQNSRVYKYTFRIEKVLKGDKSLRGRKASYEMLRTDRCGCKKQKYAKKKKLYLSGMITTLSNRRGVPKGLRVPEASVGSFIVAANWVDSSDIKRQIKDCNMYSRNFSRSLSKVRIRHADQET